MAKLDLLGGEKVGGICLDRMVILGQTRRRWRRCLEVVVMLARALARLDLLGHTALSQQFWKRRVVFEWPFS